MAETLATYEVPEHHVKMYTANVQAALNKEGGILTPLVSSNAYTGEKSQVVNFIGEVEFVERSTPYGDTKVTELEHTQVWISGREYDCAVFIDRLDTLKMIYDPTNPYVERFREAAARKMDEIIMSKFFADRKVGKDGTSTSAFGSANTVVHGNTGLTVAKLRSLRKLIKKRHVKVRTVRPKIAVTAEDVDNLLGEVAVTSADYAAIKPLVDGEVSSFMGFDFIPYEDNGGTSGDGKSIPSFQDSGSVVRQLPVWVPDGMHFGQWDGLTIKISDRADKNHIKQIHGTFTAGATRLEEGKVFQVQSKNAA
ncbi:hypothetical protein EKK58_09275 [Candidatus Dependentiae bacterium]|nr:MAG: hypothetical protein EKK58_09275 [Candidatus Dependentiae bacterium]